MRNIQDRKSWGNGAEDHEETYISLKELEREIEIAIYQSPLLLTELFQHSLINVSYLTA